MISVILFGLVITPHLGDKNLVRTNTEQNLLQDSPYIC